MQDENHLCTIKQKRNKIITYFYNAHELNAQKNILLITINAY